MKKLTVFFINYEGETTAVLGESMKDGDARMYEVYSVEGEQGFISLGCIQDSPATDDYAEVLEAMYEVYSEYLILIDESLYDTLKQEI